MSQNTLYNPANLTVMIVDDHDPIRKSIRRVLAGMGFGELVECFDGDEALKMLAKKPVDLLVLDLYMRNVSGFDVLEHIRNRDIGCDIPVIVITGEASKEEIVKVADMGAEDYVLKPFQADDLEKKVSRTLEKYYSPSPLLKTLRKAERAFMASDFKTAQAEFEAAIAIDGNSARAAHGKALTLEQLGKTEAAIELLTETIRKNHSYHRSYGTMADMYLKQNRVSDAIDAMKRELEINPKQPQRQVALAKLLLKEGDAMGAVEHYRIALQEDAKFIPALMGMGHAYAMADNLDKAIYYFKRVRRYQPKSTKALEAAVRYCLAANDPRKAELVLKDEKSAHPDRTDAYVLLAMLLLRQDREDDAMAVASELLEKDEGNASALRIKAMIFMKRRDYPNAIGALTAAAKVAPSAEIFCSLGEALLAMNKIPESMEALHKALAMNGDHPQVLIALAEAHRKSQQWCKAYYLYRKAAGMGADKQRCMTEANECFQQISGRRRPRAAS
jgi:two-component system chemotaxis response regulator CheY